MSKAAVASTVKLVVPAGKATAQPPVGPALGARGVKAIDFCKEFNARTTHLQTGIPTPALININPDRTFSFQLRSPPVSYLLKKAAGIELGSGSAGSGTPPGRVTLKHVYEIAQIKCMDKELEAAGEEKVAKSVIGSARSMGLDIIA